jgi:hypothetical protein
MPQALPKLKKLRKGSGLSEKLPAGKSSRCKSQKKPVIICSCLLAVFTILLLLLLPGWSSLPGVEKDDVWHPVRWTNKSSSPEYGKRLTSGAEQLLSVFQKARPLNPPTGLSISPSCRFVEVNLSPGSGGLLLDMAMRFPSNDAFPTAGVRVWINEPYNLLGEPVLADDAGDIFLLPPVIGEHSGQKLYSRAGHPPGSEEAFPGSKLFPLWGEEQEPFLRSVIRPTFGLYVASATTIFTSQRNSFWKPVSQERWIMAMIGRARSELDAVRKGLEAAGNTNVTRQQMDYMRSQMAKLRELFDERAVIERHEQSLKQVRELHAIMVKMNPEEAEKYYRNAMEGSDQRLEEALSAAAQQRIEIEKYEQKILEASLSMDDFWENLNLAMASGDWNSLEELGKEMKMEKLVFLADAGRAIDKLKIELNGLSPSQRRAPAYGFEIPDWHPLGPHRHVVALPFEAIRPSGLVDRGARGARALVSVDAEFFSSLEKKPAVRLIAIEWWEEVDARFRSKGGMFYNERRVTMFDELWKSLDWPALGALVD